MKIVYKYRIGQKVKIIKNDYYLLSDKKFIDGIVGKEVEIHPMHPIIMSHCGPGTLACGWYRKLKY